MKIRNKNYTHPKDTQAARDALSAALAAAPDVERLDFAAIRAAAPGLNGYSDAELAQVAQSLGLEVVA